MLERRSLPRKGGPFEPMILLIIIGALLLLGVALMVLDAAIEHACDGHEDDTGFYQESHDWNSAPSPSNSGLSLWDHLNGACCSLDMAPVFRPQPTNSKLNPPS